MKVYNRKTGRGVEASMFGVSRNKDGSQTAIFVAKHGYKVVHVPVTGDVGIGDTFTEKYITNSKGLVTSIERTTVIRQAQKVGA